MTGGRTLPLALLLLLVPLAPVGAQSEGVDARVDLYQDVDTTRMTSSTPCGGEVVTDPDGAGFLYREGDAAEQGFFEPGQTTSGCGVVSHGMFLPAGATEIRVSFFADRRVSGALSEQGGTTEQGTRLRDMDTGKTFHGAEYFDAGEGSREEALHAFVVTMPAGVRNASLEFYFIDQQSVDDNVGPVEQVSGRAFSSFVRDIAVQVRGDFAPEPEVRRSEEREGTILLEELRVTIQVPDDAFGFHSLARLRVPSGFDFERLRVPDGRTVDVGRSLDNATLRGPPAVLLERDDDALEVVVNPALAAVAGPGTYEFTLRDTADVRVSPTLLPLAGLLLFTPLPFAVVAFVQARTFAREAFGAYRRAARNLMIGVAVVLGYYLAVVASAFIAGRLDLMAVWPLPLEGLLLYIQVAAAVVAFVALWLSARALYWITRPRPGELQQVQEGMGGVGGMGGADGTGGMELDEDW